MSRCLSGAVNYVPRCKLDTEMDGSLVRSSVAWNETREKPQRGEKTVTLIERPAWKSRLVINHEVLSCCRQLPRIQFRFTARRQQIFFSSTLSRFHSFSREVFFLFLSHTKKSISCVSSFIMNFWEKILFLFGIWVIKARWAIEAERSDFDWRFSSARLHLHRNGIRVQMERKIINLFLSHAPELGTFFWGSSLNRLGLGFLFSQPHAVRGFLGKLFFLRDSLIEYRKRFQHVIPTSHDYSLRRLHSRSLKAANPSAPRTDLKRFARRKFSSFLSRLYINFPALWLFTHHQHPIRFQRVWFIDKTRRRARVSWEGIRAKNLFTLVQPLHLFPIIHRLLTECLHV